ncbi:MAG: hypothetical protein HY075_09835, partial [Deltaproteobacteria bacterium]|nr:hypothetical protein [Deltaproteobacteria bacterium]
MPPRARPGTTIAAAVTLLLAAVALSCAGNPVKGPQGKAASSAMAPTSELAQAIKARL